MSNFTFEKLKDCLKKVANREIESLSEKDNLFESGYLDSLSLIQFIVAMENDFGFTFRYSDVQFDNFRDLSALRVLLEKEYSKPS
jgi:acyl carrier protein